MYVAFGFAHGTLLVTSIAIFKYIKYAVWLDNTADDAEDLITLIAMYSSLKLAMIALEWLLRNFGILGRIVNLANYYTLKYARYLQIGAAYLLVDYAKEAYYWSEEA